MFGHKSRDDHGSARFATAAEVRRAGLLSSGGMVLGRLDGAFWIPGDLIYLKAEGHVLVSAPPGAGKTSGIVRPTLLTYPGSIFVTDIKGQSDSVHALTAGRREELKSEVHVLDPFGMTQARKAGVDLFSLIVPSDPMEGATRIASIVVPVRESGDQYFQQEARSLLALLFAGVAQPGNGMDGAARLLAIRSQLQAAPADMVDLFRALEKSPHAPVRNGASYFRGMLEEAPKQFIGARSEAASRCTSFDHAGVRSMLTAGTFDPSQMKNRSMTVYLVMTIDQLHDHCAAARLVIELLLRRLVESPANPRNSVLLLIDEFANMGPMPRLVESLTHTRSAGVRTALIVQSVGQLRSLYGDNKTQTIRDSSHIQVYMSPSSHEDCEYIARRVGQETRTDVKWSGFKWPWDFIKTGPRPVGKTVMIDWGHVAKTGWFGYNFGKDPRGMFQNKEERVWGRQLITPDEVAAQPHGTLFLFAQGVRPIRGRTIRDFDDCHFKGLLGRRLSSPPPPPPAAARPATFSPPTSTPPPSSTGAPANMAFGFGKKKSDLALWEKTKPLTDADAIPTITGVSDSDHRNTSKRILTVLALDVSTSMEHNGGLKQLNQGLQVFKQQLASAPRHVADRVDLTLITFAGQVTANQKSCNVMEWTPPELKAQLGGTDLAGAIVAAFDVLAARREALEREGISVATRGYVFAMTDGQPEPAAFMEAVPAAKSRIREEVDEKGTAWFNAIGVAAANRELLASLREPQDAHYLPDCDFVSLFKYLSKKSIDVSAGKIGEDVNPLHPIK